MLDRMRTHRGSKEAGRQVELPLSLSLSLSLKLVAALG